MMRKTALLLSLALAGCSPGPVATPVPGDSGTPKMTRVLVVKCERRDVLKQVELPADVFPHQQAMLYARVSGYLEAVNVDRGDQVREGQLLASIRLPEVEQEVSQAREVYARGQAERAAALARVPRAQSERSAAEGDLRRVTAQEKQLQAELQRSLASERQAREEGKLAEATTRRLLSISAEDAGLIAAQELDVSRTAARVSQEKMRAAQNAVAAARQSLAAGAAARAAARSRLEASESAIRVTEAQLVSSTHQGEADFHAAEKATHLLAYREIRAPFSGTITGRYLDAGALVQSADRSAQTSTKPVLAIADFETVRVRIEVPQDLTSTLHVGTEAQILLDGVDHPLKARISRMSGSLDMSTRTMVAEIDVPNRDHVLHPGMYVKAVLDVGTHKHVLSVPKEAVVIDRNRSLVVVDDNGKARHVSIKPGFANRQWVEVLDGLKEGDQVVVSAPDKVANETPLEVRWGSPGATPTP